MVRVGVVTVGGVTGEFYTVCHPVKGDLIRATGRNFFSFQEAEKHARAIRLATSKPVVVVSIFLVGGVNNG
jgi:hypothetical protein